MNRVTLLIPSYNNAATVAETVVSIRAQTDLNRLARIVLLDDASRDETVAVARAAAGDMPLIVERVDENLGPWPNFNRGLTLAGGHAEWALVLHADDTARPDWLAEMCDRIDSCADDVGAIGSSWNVIWPDHSITTGENAPEPVRRVDAGDAEVAGTLLRGCWWKLSGGAIRIAAFADAGPFDPQFHQCGDWDWLLRLLGRGWAVEYIPRSLVDYRQHMATMSTQSLREDREILESLRLLDRYAGLIPRARRASFLARRANYLMRRAGRAILNRDAQRLATVLRTAAILARSAGRHAW